MATTAAADATNGAATGPQLAAIYARVSTDEQTKGTVASLDTQVEKCREKAAALSIPVAQHLIVKEQHSGADLRWEGTQFMGLVRRAEQHEFTDLFCLDVDRFCRGGPAAYWEQEGYFLDAGVAIHWIYADVPENMPFAGTIKTARAEAAQWQRDKTLEASMRIRTAWAKAGNIVRGVTPPFGFQFVYDPVRRTKRNRPIVTGLVPDPVTGPILLHMTHHVASGGTILSLKHWVEEKGIKPSQGGAVWSTESIRQILRNPTNYGGRKSFAIRQVERPEGSKRKATLKTKHTYMKVPEEQQYPVTDGRVTPIPGLTYDLWKRAIDQLAYNKAYSPRRTALPEPQRAERALLFGGPVRCAVCGHAMRLKRNTTYHRDHGEWAYHCVHYGTLYDRTPSVSMQAYTVDHIAWEFAVEAMRDPAKLERLIADTDAINGAAVRATSLRRQLADVEKERDVALKHLRRLDPDDADNVGLIADIEMDVRRLHTRREDLNHSLQAVEQQAAAEESRRATIQAFRAYAAAQVPTLDQKTAYEKRRILLALKTYIRIGPDHTPDRFYMRFDIRTLPGVALVPSIPQGPEQWIDFGHSVPLLTVEWLQYAGGDAEDRSAPQGEANSPGIETTRCPCQ